MKTKMVCLWIMALLASLYMRQADAVQIRQILWSGDHVLLLTGKIEPGDTVKLAEALAKAKPLAHGLPVVLLDSGGGSVSEALEISALFERSPVHTVVPKEAHCASACASIVFISGRYRTVEEGGLLGQHSCAVDGIKDDKCNDIISNHAIAKGVSHGSIAAFITYGSPREMIWFSREQADCWDLTRYPFTFESGAEPRTSPPGSSTPITTRKAFLSDTPISSARMTPTKPSKPP